MNIPWFTIGLTIGFMGFFAALFPRLIELKATPYLRFVGGLIGASAGFLLGARLDGAKIGPLLTFGIMFAPVLITLLLVRSFVHEDGQTDD